MSKTSEKLSGISPGKLSVLKRCNDCRKFKPRSQFTAYQTPLGLRFRPYCKPCANLRTKTWQRKHPKLTLEPFSGWAGPQKPKMLIIGEAWGEHEAQVRQPFVGSSGQELWRMLGEAMPQVFPEDHLEALKFALRFGNGWVRARRPWLEAAGIAFTNVLNLRPPGNRLDSLCASKKEVGSDYTHPPISRAQYLRPQYLPELQRLLAEIKAAVPNLVVAAGNTACWALLRATNIGSIRGSVTYSTTEPSVKVLPTYHPAGVLRQWSWRPIVVADFIKADREAQFPELIRPQREIIVNPCLTAVQEWAKRTLASPPKLLAVDIETKWKQIQCIGFARSRSEAIVVPFIDSAHPSGSYWPTLGAELSAWAAVKTILESPIPKLFQNGSYDLQYIWKMGIRVANAAEDTMLLHHSLFPEMLKGLGFLGSIYSNEAAWKLMSRPKADTEKRDE